MLRHLLVIGIFLCLGTPAVGDDSTRTLASALTGRAASVIDGNTFALDHPIDGAMRVRLAGIQVPRRSAGQRGSRDETLAEEARDALAAMILNRGVVLDFTGPRADRHGRLTAQVYDDEGKWIQGEMLERGLARVLTFADNRALAAEMLAREDSARTQALGIWSHPLYAVLAPEQAEKHIGSFQLVEGRVFKAARVKNHVYLNFGADWRTDFTVSVQVKHLPRFADAGLDSLALGGRVIRVRGWIKEFSGPMIDATHPEQIEVLEPIHAE